MKWYKSFILRKKKIFKLFQGGLYEKWSTDFISEARRASRAKQQGQGQGEEEEQGEETDIEANLGVSALTVQHLQGPLLLLVLILGFTLITFLCEVMAWRYCGSSHRTPHKH